MRLREGLRADDRAAIERILHAVGVFRKDEIAVAMELVDAGLSSDDRGYRFVVASDADRVLGYACFGHAPLTDAVYDLYWIAVDPSVHGRGLGRRILARVESIVCARGGRMILVETEGTSAYVPARRFYERAGYAELARVRDYYRPGADKVIFGRAPRPEP